MKTRQKNTVPKEGLDDFPKFIGIFFPADQTVSTIIDVSKTRKKKKLEFVSKHNVKLKMGPIWYDGEVIASGGKLLILLYRGSPTYTKITNTVSTNTVFGLCTCKWGN